jgi:hypothetical protein
MSYVELYSMDPTVTFVFKTGRVTIFFRKEQVSGWYIKSSHGDPIRFERQKVWEVLEFAGLKVEEFVTQLEMSCLTFAAVALIGIEDLSREIPLHQIMEAKNDWVLFMNEVNEITSNHAQTTSSPASSFPLPPPSPSIPNPEPQAAMTADLPRFATPAGPRLRVVK